MYDHVVDPIYVELDLQGSVTASPPEALAPLGGTVISHTFWHDNM